jgi:uncharacterized surface anchored protein
MTFSQYCYAITPGIYSYKKLHDALPDDMQSSDFVYEENGAGFLAFCKYKDSGTNYRTTVKHDGNDLYYCINYSDHFTSDKTFSLHDSRFSDELRARLALAIHLGTSKWNTKANKGYTTGNFLEDYYMTQVVIHGLIYKYGDKYKDRGVDIKELTFKSGTGNLKKKTMSFYNACCEAIYIDKRATFQKADFSFEKPNNKNLYFDKDNNCLISKQLSCITSADNGTVESFNRFSTLYDSNSSVVFNDIIKQDSYNYDSPYSFYIPVSKIDVLDPGVYSARVSETLDFKRVVADEWFCIDPNYLDNQQVLGEGYVNDSLLDTNMMDLVIGRVELTKKDSLTGENISDASFKLYEYDDTKGDFVFYKDLTYDSKSQKYISGNIYCSINNSSGKFKVIESDSGQTHHNDWGGQEFVLSKDNYYYEFQATNTPVLGNLKVKKTSDKVLFDEKKHAFVYDNDKINLSGIQFVVYAAEDIYYKNQLIYPKETKIHEITTDQNGNGFINEMIPGRYYLTESQTTSLHVLDVNKYYFEIKKESTGYSTIEYNLDNHIKKCSIHVYKHTSNNSNKPIEGCKFGLYSQNDVCNNDGSLIIKKDELIDYKTTNSKGELQFDNLICINYYLKEISVPDGVIISDTPIEVSVNDFIPKDNKDGIYNANKDISNNTQLYNVKLYKFGQHFTSFSQNETINGTYFNYNYEFAPLKNVTYSIYNNDQQLVATQTTNDNGIVNFSGLEYGDFYCVEKETPGMYERNTAKIPISCKDLNVDKTSGKPIEIVKKEHDNLCQCSISIKKLGEKVVVKNKKLTFKESPLEGVVYGIYQCFEYTFPSGEKLPANSCVGYINTNNNGIGQFLGTLPEGKYYIKEIKQLPGYSIDYNEREFEIKSNNNKKIDIDFTDSPYINYLEKANVKIIKTDSDTGKKLKGVEFTLYNDNKEIIGVYKTDKNGEIVVSDLPYGKYYFVETKCLDGYYSSNNKYNFELNNSGIKILDITNTPIYKLGNNEHYKIILLITCIIFLMLALSIFFNNRVRKGN